MKQLPNSKNPYENVVVWSSHPGPDNAGTEKGQGIGISASPHVLQKPPRDRLQQRLDAIRELLQCDPHQQTAPVAASDPESPASSTRSQHCDPLKRRSTTEERLLQVADEIYANIRRTERSLRTTQDSNRSHNRPNGSNDTTISEWRALMILHRTLLQSSHNFYWALQHPAAPPALHTLASEFSMPTRIWRRGIRSFLSLYPAADTTTFLVLFVRYARSLVMLLQNSLPHTIAGLEAVKAAIDNFILVLQSPTQIAPTREPSEDTGFPLRSTQCELYSSMFDVESETGAHEFGNISSEIGPVRTDCWHLYYSLKMQVLLSEPTVVDSRSEYVSFLDEPRLSFFEYSNQWWLDDEQPERRTTPSLAVNTHRIRPLLDSVIGWLFYRQSIAKGEFETYHRVFEILKFAARQWKHWLITGITSWCV